MAEMGEDWLALLPEFLLLVGAVGGLLLGLWTPQHRQGRVRNVAVTACMASAVAATVALIGPDAVVFDGTWAIDTTTGVVRLTVTVGTALAILLGTDSLSGHPRETEAYVLMLLGAIGADALAASGDLLMLVAAYLLASIPLYALAGFAKDARGTEATVKYYLMGALVGVLLLVGVTTLLLATGSSSYADHATTLPDAPRPLVAVGVLGVLAGMLFKAGAVPVHFWVPDVTAGATPPMAAFITTIPKIGAVAAAFRLVAEPFAALDVDVPLIVAIVAAASMTLGNLAAFAQDELLRLLAYSTISQVGYLLMVVAVAGGTELATPALSIYLAGYAVTNLGAFAAVAAFPEVRTIDAWARAASRHRWAVLSLVVCLLGLVGTPPTAVFIGKLAIFSAAADGGLVWLVVLAAVNTVASLFYYLRWILPAFQAGNEDCAGVRPARSATAVLYACAMASVALGIGSGAWLALAE